MARRADQCGRAILLLLHRLAVISGLLVFGQFPMVLAVCGILLVVYALTIVSLDQRKRRLTVVA